MSEVVNTKLSVYLSILQDIAARTWGKEDELKALKAELATLDHKITAELALPPKQEEQDFGEEIKPDEIQKVGMRDNPSQATDSKESMVTEPQRRYQRTPHIKSLYKSL